MDNTTLLIIVIVVLLFLGAFFGRGRWVVTFSEASDGRPGLN
jgi:hypothetical protein